MSVVQPEYVQHTKKTECGCALLTLLLHGCAASPVTSHRQCRIQYYRAVTVYTENVWTVTFDSQTRQLLASQKVPGTDLLSLNELDCLLHQELDEKCPRWIHDSNIAVDLHDGRLQASGLCKSETSDADT